MGSRQHLVSSLLAVPATASVPASLLAVAAASAAAATSVAATAAAVAAAATATTAAPEVLTGGTLKEAQERRQIEGLETKKLQMLSFR